MNARFYIPALARFVSADTVIPDHTNPQSLNGYTYVLNSPLRYLDPDGHAAVEGDNPGAYSCSGGTQAHGGGCYST